MLFRSWPFGVVVEAPCFEFASTAAGDGVTDFEFEAEKETPGTVPPAFDFCGEDLLFFLLVLGAVSETDSLLSRLVFLEFKWLLPLLLFLFELLAADTGAIICVIRGAPSSSLSSKQITSTVR